MAERARGAPGEAEAFSVAAVIVAGGSGRRMGAPVRKQYLEILGEPVLLRAVRPFVDHPGVGEVVVVLPEEDAGSPPSWLVELGLRVVAGGDERGDSVWNGLAAVRADSDAVLIHDGARPFVSSAVIDRVLAGARTGGVIAAVPVTDTIKEVEGDRIVGTPERARLWQAQTPQGFPRVLLLDVYTRARTEGVAATDDAALLERYGHAVRVVEGAPENVKITRPTDLYVAEALARSLLAR